MIDYCVERNTTFIGLKNTLALGCVASAMAFASPEYELNFIDKKDAAVPQRSVSLFSQDIDSIQSSEQGEEKADAEEFNNAMKVLGSFAGLDKGWDGYEAEPISSKSIDLAERLLKAIRVVKGLILGWDVSPTGRGSVQIEKTTKDGYYEIEMFEDGLMSCYSQKKENCSSTDFKSINDAVSWVVNVVS